jgi:hypothetical protein
MRTTLLLVVIAVCCGCSTRQQRSVAASATPQAAPPDPIAQLVARLSSASHGMWHNGLYSPVKLPASASTEEVLRQVFQQTLVGLQGAHVGRHQVLETRQVRIPTAGPSDAYTAVLVETDLGRKVVLLQYESPGLGWWSRVYDG